MEHWYIHYHFNMTLYAVSTLSFYFSVNGYLGCILYCVFANDAAVNILMQVSHYTCVNGSNLKYRPRGMALLKGIHHS